MEKSIFHYKVNQQDLDFTQHVSATSIIRDILSVAGRDASSHNFGVESLNKSNHTWVLSRLSIQFDGLPRAEQTYSISTWIVDYNKLFSTRNFSIEGADFSVQAITQWCILDLSSRRPVDLSLLPEQYRECVIPEALPIKPPRKIANIVEPHSSITRQMMYSDIDFNQHVNTLRYVDMMLNLLPLEIIKERRYIFDLQFIHECYIGQMLTTEMEVRDNIYLFSISQEDGTVAVRGAITPMD